MTKFIAALLVSVGFFSNSYSLENSRDQKIYVKPDQIQLQGSGIYVLLNNQRVQVSSLQSDAKGLYVEYNSYACKYGHPSPNLDGFCNYPGCPFNRG